MTPPDDPDGGGRLKSALEIVGGLVGYVVVIGAAVNVLRFGAARLSPKRGITAIDRTDLVYQAALVLVFELVVLVIVAVVTALISALITHVSRLSISGDKIPSILVALAQAALAVLLLASTADALDITPSPLFVVIGFVLVVVLQLGALAVRARDHIHFRLPQWAGVVAAWTLGGALVIAAGVFAWAPIGVMIIALVGMIPLLLWASKKPPAGRTLLGFLRWRGVWSIAVLLTAIVVAYEATPPVAFDRVILKSGRVAAYLGKSDGGLDIATCTTTVKGTSTDAGIDDITAKEAAGHRVVSRPKYRFDSGGRPSLFDLAATLAGSSERLDEVALVHPELRPRSDGICGT